MGPSYRPSGMKPSLVAAVAIAVAGTVSVGCGSSSRNGLVVGQYSIVGGPAPGLERPLPGTVWAYAGRFSWPDVVKANPAAHVNTDEAGRFQLSLPPGKYTIVATGVSNSPKHRGCTEPVTVEVRASTRRQIKLVCDVP